MQASHWDGFQWLNVVDRSIDVAGRGNVEVASTSLYIKESFIYTGQRLP